MYIYTGLRRIANIALALIAIWGCALGGAFALILMDPSRTNAVETFLALGAAGTVFVGIVWGLVWLFRALFRKKSSRPSVME